MRRAELAAGLRQRLRARDLVPDATLDATPDTSIIDSYVICSCCGQRQVSDALLADLIRQARTTDDWLALLDAEALVHS